MKIHSLKTSRLVFLYLSKNNAKQLLLNKVFKQKNREPLRPPGNTLKTIQLKLNPAFNNKHNLLAARKR